MTLSDRLADWITGGALTRARHDRDVAQRSVRAVSLCVGADIPIGEHVDALRLLGAVLARFAEPPGDGRALTARAGESTVARWREQHTAWSQRLAAEMRAPSRAPSRIVTEVARG